MEFGVRGWGWGWGCCWWLMGGPGAGPPLLPAGVRVPKVYDLTEGVVCACLCMLLPAQGSSELTPPDPSLAGVFLSTPTQLETGATVSPVSDPGAYHESSHRGPQRHGFREPSRVIDCTMAAVGVKMTLITTPTGFWHHKSTDLALTSPSHRLCPSSLYPNPPLPPSPRLPQPPTRARPRHATYPDDPGFGLGSSIDELRAQQVGRPHCGTFTPFRDPTRRSL